MAKTPKPQRARRQFTDEFKAEAVRLVLDEGKSMAVVARDLDLVPSALRGWVEQARADRDHALGLAEALRKRFGATVAVVDGGLGQFDVIVNGTLLSSRGRNLLARLKSPRLPEVSDIIAAIDGHELHPQSSAPSAQGASVEFGPDDAKRFYDRFGVWQDRQIYERAALEHLVAHADFSHASAVFELGCGTGRFAERLLRSHLAADTPYVGIDISTTMVRIATGRLARWPGRAAVQQADGTANLMYADRAFDRFVATYVLDLLPESAIGRVLAEAHRVLRPGGKLCVATLTEGVTPLSRVVATIWKRIHGFDPRLVGGCRPLRVSPLLDHGAWTIEHTHTVCSWAICSEIVIAAAADVGPQK